MFGFKFVPKDQNKRVTNTILHHSCPTRDDLLFAYEFGLNGKFKGTEECVRACVCVRKTEYVSQRKRECGEWVGRVQ